ncbi:MAG: toxic anion resistance protein [Gammaproteobacteria bacterium]|nr:toxic anion resistance protein [Gammaproteobacteria bacterium]
MANETETSVDHGATTIVGGDLHVAAANLPELKHEIVHYSTAAPEERARIEELMETINLADTNSIIFFGTKAQEQLTTVSDSMLEGVKNKDLGAAGDSLSEMVATLRGFDTDALEKPGFFARLFGRAKPIVKFLQRYEGVRKQIDNISNDLDSHKTKLLTDITSLDRLYEANLQYFHDLELYIAAGEEKLKQLDDNVIPELDQQARQTEDVIKAQELRDLRSARDDLERRVHDLQLTRQVTMQGLPSIRLVQENDKGLVTKINSTMANTIPLWQTQLATAVTIARSHAAAKSVKAASDLTNELLEENAEALKSSNAEVRAQIERGVFDIESVKKANQSLIDTIEESLQIADEGKRRRAEAVVQLEEMEANLKAKLSEASSRATGG